ERRQQLAVLLAARVHLADVRVVRTAVARNVAAEREPVQVVADVVDSGLRAAHDGPPIAEAPDYVGRSQLLVDAESLAELRRKLVEPLDILLQLAVDDVAPVAVRPRAAGVVSQHEPERRARVPPLPAL